MRSIVRTTLPIVAIVVLLTVTAAAQSTQDPQPNAPPQGTAPDLLEQLRLTPEQRQKIRQIQRDTKDERTAIGLRLRESNRALEDALDAELNSACKQSRPLKPRSCICGYKRRSESDEYSILTNWPCGTISDSKRAMS